MRCFGDNLKAARIQKGLSQEELAKIVGTTKQVISKYENNQRTPKVTVANAFAEALGVSLRELLGEQIDGKNAPGEAEGEWMDLTQEEHQVLQLFRSASPEVKQVILAALAGGQQKPD